MKRLIPVIIILSLLVCGFSADVSAQSGYADVSPGVWYYDSVSFVTEKGLFTGTSDTSFSPGGVMTRGMFVTVLGRYAGGTAASVSGTGKITKSDVNLRSAPNTSSNVLAVLARNTIVQIVEISGNWYKIKYGSLTGYVRNDLMEPVEASFSDVPSGKYYSPYVSWAFQKNIVSGTSDTTFSPDSSITREQICTILSNYASSVYLTLSPVVSKAVFNDDAKISGWAKDAVYQLQQAGVITGRDTGAFDPKAYANRAEVAVIMQRFINSVGYKPESEPSFDSNGNYIYGTALPETGVVNDSYFDNACFIGHSFVLGMQSYFGLKNADFIGVNGIAASTMLSYDKFELDSSYTDEEGNERRNTGTLEDLLRERAYGKIYLMLGTNELGSEAYHQSSYYNSMCSLVDIVRRNNPGAIIYLIAIPPVSRNCSENSENYNRNNIIAFNSKLKQVSKDKNAVYLDAFTLFADIDGYLPDDSCLPDGIHILSPQYAQLKGFLKTHTLR